MTNSLYTQYDPFFICAPGARDFARSLHRIEIAISLELENLNALPTTDDRSIVAEAGNVDAQHFRSGPGLERLPVPRHSRLDFLGTHQRIQARRRKLTEN